MPPTQRVPLLVNERLAGAGMQHPSAMLACMSGHEHLCLPVSCQLQHAGVPCLDDVRAGSCRSRCTTWVLVWFWTLVYIKRKAVIQTTVCCAAPYWAGLHSVVVLHGGARALLAMMSLHFGQLCSPTMCHHAPTPCVSLSILSIRGVLQSASLHVF